MSIWDSVFDWINKQIKDIGKENKKTKKPVLIGLSFLNQFLQPQLPPDSREPPTNCTSTKNIVQTFMSQD